jgi:hypothetical protein
MDAYTALYRKGCTPPDSATWGPIGNNERFLAQAERPETATLISTAARRALETAREQEFYEGGSYGRKAPGSTRLPLRVLSTGSLIGLASSSKGFTPGAKLSSVITPSTVSKPRPKLSS